MRNPNGEVSGVFKYEERSQEYRAVRPNDCLAMSRHERKMAVVCTPAFDVSKIGKRTADSVRRLKQAVDEVPHFGNGALTPHVVKSQKAISVKLGTVRRGKDAVDCCCGGSHNATPPSSD